MGWYTRGKLSLDGFRCFASWDSPQNPVFQSCLRILRSGYSNSGSKEATLNGFPSFSSVSHRLGTRDLEVNKTFRNPFFSVGARRFHHLDPHNVKHFRPRGWRRWFQNPTHVFIGLMVGSGVLISLYFGNLETIPCTKRTHWIMIWKDLERWLGESWLEMTKAALEGKIFPPTHPDTVRVKMIANDIIDALQRELRTEHVRSGLGQERGSRPVTSHLDGLNCEILVVNKPVLNAFSVPGGKIVVFTGLLEHITSDAEIATVIGHEVGHVVARHTAEIITNLLQFAILPLIFFQFVPITPYNVNTMSSRFPPLPFSRRNVSSVMVLVLYSFSSAMAFTLYYCYSGRRKEREADYIGLLLIALAGYDPRVAPKVYEKLGNLTGKYDYLSTHPSGRKRAELLAQTKIMEEALIIYKDVREGRGVQEFL